MQNVHVSQFSCCQIEKGISRIGKPLDDINTAIENAGKLEIYKLEKNVLYHFWSRSYDWFQEQ
jgi:hypothetical protein